MEDSYEAASTRDVRFRRWFPKKPRPAFRRGRTFREELVKARLPSGTGVDQGSELQKVSKKPSKKGSKK